MGQVFQFATRQFSEAESALTTVERINAPVPQESLLWRAPDGEEEGGRREEQGNKGADSSGVRDEGESRGPVSLPVTPAVVPAEWPHSGAISLVNVCVRYRAGLPLVLRNVTFSIAPGHRVGASLLLLTP